MKPDDISGEARALPSMGPRYEESSHCPVDMEVARRNRCVGLLHDAPEINAYKLLRTRINQIMRERGGKTLMVTSVRPGEGKTLTAVNLSLTFAREFSQTVLLMDCDLMRQDVHKRLGITSERGLGDYLLGHAELKDLIIWPGVDKLTLISGGETIRDSAELLGSPQMRELITEVRERYHDRYVIFDAPPVLGTADVVAFAPLVDAILLVVEEGATRQEEIEKACALLPAEKLIGVVFNGREFSSRERASSQYY